VSKARNKKFRELRNYVLEEIEKGGNRLTREQICEFVLKKRFPNAKEPIPIQQTIAELFRQDHVVSNRNQFLSLTRLYRTDMKKLNAKKAKETEEKARKRIEREVPRSGSEKSPHLEAKRRIFEFGELRNKTAEPEYRLTPDVKIDMVWHGGKKKNKVKNLSHIFEVENEGCVKNAIHNLGTAQRYYPAAKLYLVIANAKKMDSSRRMVRDFKQEQINVIPAKDVSLLIGSLKVAQSHELELINKLQILGF